MNEIIFIAEETAEGGFLARVPGESLFTQAESVDDPHAKARDAVHCHFDEGQGPKLIRPHFVRDEVIAA